MEWGCVGLVRNTNKHVSAFLRNGMTIWKVALAARQKKVGNDGSDSLRICKIKAGMRY
jgi:hypothetical protein